MIIMSARLKAIDYKTTCNNKKYIQLTAFYKKFTKLFKKKRTVTVSLKFT